MRKQWTAALIASTLAAALLGGCAKEAGTAANQEKPEDTGIAEYYVDEDGNKYKKYDDVKLNMLVCWNGGFKRATDQYNNDVAKAIREKIGVTVEFEEIMMSETEKLNMMFASGDMPDMVNSPYWGGNAGETEVVKKAGVQGRLIDIRDMVPNYPNIADAYNDGVVSKKFLENDIDYPENKGARYVLPTEVPGDDNGVTNWAYGVFVRSDVGETLGIDPAGIKNQEDLYDFMVKARDYGFKDVNGNDCIVATTFHDGWDYSQYGISFRQKKLTDYSLDENGKVTFFRLTDDWMDENLFIWKLVNQNLLDKECFRTSDDRAKEKVGNGSALFVASQYNIIIEATKLTGLYESNPDMRYTWVGPMNYIDGQELKQTEAYGRNGAPAIYFPTTCTNIEAALTWLDYTNSREGSKLICYGFEGDTYDLNEDGQPRMNDELTKMYAKDNEEVKKQLRERGINYMQGRTQVANKYKTWFGESAPFEEAAENEYVKGYKEARPVERLQGYQIDALAPNYEKYDEVSEVVFQGTTEKDYKERAFFAKTEEEARSVLEDYQHYIRTQNNGVFMEFLDYMTEMSTYRDDIVF